MVVAMAARLTTMKRKTSEVSAPMTEVSCASSRLADRDDANVELALLSRSGRRLVNAAPSAFEGGAGEAHQLVAKCDALGEIHADRATGVFLDAPHALGLVCGLSGYFGDCLVCHLTDASPQEGLFGAFGAFDLFDRGFDFGERRVFLEGDVAAGAVDDHRDAVADA